MLRQALITAVPLFLATLFLFFVGLWEEKYDKISYKGVDQYRINACGNLLTTYYTGCGGHGHGGLFGCYCTNPVLLSSFLGCFDRYGLSADKTVDLVHKECNDPELTKAMLHRSLDTFHKESVFVNVTGRWDIGHLTHAQMLDHTAMGNESVIVDFGTYFPDLFVRIYTARMGNHDKSLLYSIGGIAFWMGLCLIATIANWTVRLVPSSRNLFDGTYSRAWRKYVTLPALIDRKRNQEQKCWTVFDGLVPTRFESLALFSFLAYTFITQIVHIYYVDDNPFWDGNRSLAFYVGDRTGIPSLIWTLLLIIFGGRSNILQWLTGWKFSTFVAYHRWIARIVVLLAVAHSIAFTYNEHRRGTYHTSIILDFLIYACIATIAGCLMCFQGLLWLRRKSYEIFLIIHIILAALWIMGCWVHVEWFGYTPFMIAAACLWVADRVIRFLRMGYFGTPKATVLLIEGDTLRVVVPKSPTMKTIPGGHCWVYFGYGLAFWQNHPFCYIESPDGKTMTFICKVKGGLTKKIGDHLEKLPEKSCQMRVAIEGCYGETSPVSRHSSIVYLAGGHGFPGVFSEASHEAARSPEKQSIKLHWIIKDLKALLVVWKELQFLATTKIETTIYVTRPESTRAELAFLKQESCESSINEKEETLAHVTALSCTSSSEKESIEVDMLMQKVKDFFPHITFVLKRPLIDNIISNEIEESTESAAFITCGHPAMVDDVRAGVVSRIDTTEKRIDFFEQLQVWT
ncbi:hypothetical protein C7M61_001392 [Candidozyma pseudohaemuli]|uniref:FAD-binding FR-type domain-containing protein n=1 Tax=Candidozyma pseudohaemuli TaxID=418784 RepID=A0A2P7YUF0_9ASCO|nr:hypothetical protein C7M61_001392 [[Candida] pseudohaemulonii]PSK39593.1 hypothetical protein C7M61_001392 [[Candida] pseudohaemulonii]